MNAARLNELLAHPRTLSGEDLGALENLCRDFPAFGLPYILLAKAYHDRSDYRYRETLHAAALRCPNRVWLRDFMEDKLEVPQAESTPEVLLTATSHEATSLPIISETAVPEMPLPDEPENSLQPSEETAVIIPEPETGTGSNPGIDTETGTGTADTEKEEPAIEPIPQANIANPDRPEEEVKVQPEGEKQLLRPAVPAEKPWRRKHVDPAAMTVYSIEDHFPPSEEPESEAGVRDFFGWLRNPHKSLEPPPAKPETKEEKDDLIQRFLASRPSVSRPKKEFFNPVNMAKKSEQEDPELVTETLANIYWKQGNREKAIAMFEKLILKYPGKRPYFAALIQKIRQENES